MARPTKEQSKVRAEEQKKLEEQKQERIKELKKKVQATNRKIAKLEKSGVAESSNAYSYLEFMNKGSRTQQHRSFMKTQTAPRFRTDLNKMSERQLQALENNVDKFNEAKTSTVRGAKARYSKATATLNERLKDKHIKLTNTDTKTLFESLAYKQMSDGGLASDTIIETYNKIKKAKKKSGKTDNIVEFMNDYLKDAKPHEIDNIINDYFVKEESENPFEKPTPSKRKKI